MKLPSVLFWSDLHWLKVVLQSIMGLLRHFIMLSMFLNSIEHSLFHQGLLTSSLTITMWDLARDATLSNLGHLTN